MFDRERGIAGAAFALSRRYFFAQSSVTASFSGWVARPESSKGVRVAGWHHALRILLRACHPKMLEGHNN
jgi:hypothetical protein